MYWVFKSKTLLIDIVQGERQGSSFNLLHVEKGVVVGGKGKRRIMEGAE
jgi:hypothetical protein